MSPKDRFVLSAFVGAVSALGFFFVAPDFSMLVYGSLGALCTFFTCWTLWAVGA